MERCRVLIVDGHEMVRVGLHTILSQEEDVEVVGEAFDKEGAILEVQRTQPDVVLMDGDMPGMFIHELCQLIGNDSPKTQFLVLHANSNDEAVAASLQAGIVGYLPKSVSREELLRAVRGAHRRASSQSPLSAQGVRRTASGGATEPTTPGASPLSRREQEVLDLIDQGLTNRAIAARLYLSEKTVRNHVSHVFHKLGVSSRREAAAYANRAKRTRPPTNSNPPWPPPLR